MADNLFDKTRATADDRSSCSSASTSSFGSILNCEIKSASYVSQRAIDALALRGIIVRQDGLANWAPQSALHPRNWSCTRKCYDTRLIMFLEFLVTEKTALFYFTFAYFCGQAAGGLFLPPISETFGTKCIYTVTTALYGLANLLIAVFPLPPVIVATRLCAGFFSAAPGTVAAGSIENIWNVQARVRVVHLWVVTAVAGLSCGPPLVSLVSLSALEWRRAYMIFGLTSITAAMLCMLMKESRPSRILLRNVQEVRKQTGTNGIYNSDAAASPSISTFCHTSLLLPLRLVFTEPIVALTSTMAASVYAIIYMFPEALPHVHSSFEFDTFQISLSNLAMLCGVPFTFISRLFDVRLALLRRGRGRQAEPEDKLVGCIVAGPCLAIAFLVFAISVPPLQTHVSFWISLACLAAFEFSAVEFDNALSGYLTDSYSSWAASANAPMAFLRAIFSGIFPLFAGDMFTVLGANNATFVLAGIATVYCGVAVWFVRYGRSFRAKSGFASKIAQSDSRC